MRECCENCKFWDQYEYGSKEGWCRRHPPVLALAVPAEADPADRQYWHFPSTTDGNWCGEFKPRA